MSAKTVLEVNIDKVKAGNKIILSEVKFILGANKIYTILGKNGSGKSTLLKSIVNLLPGGSFNVEGKIFYKGENLSDNNTIGLRNKKAAGKIRYVFQDAKGSLDPLKKTGYYFDLYNIDRGKAEEYFDYFLLGGTERIYDLYPYELSGGMAQRINVILALLAEPELLLLDEPDSSLDAPISNLLLLKLKEYVSSGKGTVLLVTQNVPFALKASDLITVLKDGSLTPFYETAVFEEKSDIIRF